MCFRTFRRRLEAEASRISYIPSLIAAGICIALAIIVSVTGKSGYYKLLYALPRGTPSFLFRVFLEGVFYAVLGFSLGAFLFCKQICGRLFYWQTAFLFVCAIFFSYARTIAVYQAGALFFGLLYAVLTLLCLCLLFFTLKENCFLFACCVFACFLLSFFFVYHTLTIFLLNA